MTSRFAERAVDTTPKKKAKIASTMVITESIYTFQDGNRIGTPTGRGGLDFNHPKKANAEMDTRIAPVDLANAYRYIAPSFLARPAIGY
jgi:hypothetical protein